MISAMVKFWNQYFDINKSPERDRAFFGVLWDNFYSIVLLVVLFLFYWKFAQAKDLLLILNRGSGIEMLTFFLSLVLLATSCWFLPKFIYLNHVDDRNKLSWKSIEKFLSIKGLTALFSHEADDLFRRKRQYIKKNIASDTTKKGPDEHRLIFETYRKFYQDMIPRLLGCGVFLIVALGLLNAVNEVGIYDQVFIMPAFITLLGIAVFTLFYLIFGKREFLNTSSLLQRFEQKKLAPYLFFIFEILVFIFLILYFVFLNKRGLSQGIFFGIMITLGIGFLCFTVFRKITPLFRNDILILLILFMVVFGISVDFIKFNFDASESQKVNPLVCANMAFVLYLSLFYVGRILGAKYRIRFVLLGIVGLTALYKLMPNDKFYEVEYVKNEYKLEARKDLDQYFTSWINGRDSFIRQYLKTHSTDSFPIFIVAAEGGGSRAAYWTSMVHSAIQESVPDYYNYHLFALTGASGGTTGNSHYFAMKEGGVPDTAMYRATRGMFGQNYVSSSITRVLGLDIWQQLTGINAFSNRAKILKAEWVKQQKEVSGVTDFQGFDRSFLSFWYNPDMQLKTPHGHQATPPLLLINTTHVQTGSHVVISPVKLNADYYGGSDLLEMLEKDQTLDLGTAVLLNASFPYVNPAGFVRGHGNFVDAGYYDNYGDQVASSMIKNLKALCRERAKSDTTGVYGRLKFVAVQLLNGSASPQEDLEKISNLQFSAPAVTAGKLRSAYNTYNNWTLSKVADQYYPVRRQNVEITLENGKRVKPIVPLARYLIPMAMTAMDTSLQQLNTGDGVLVRIKAEMK